MARLPIPGSDDNVWGDILNEFLSVEHNTDGTLKASGSLASKVSTSRQITAGTGLSGGGDLSADRTLSVTYGTTSGTAAQGNDSRITGAMQHGDLMINVKDYGAVGDGTTNDTTAITTALTAAANRTLYFPKGTYKLDPDAIIVSSPCRLVGENYLSTVLISSSGSPTGVGIKITSVNVDVANLYVRGFYSGIENHTTYTKIYDCKLSYNTIGIDFYETSYIVKVRGNEITFNSVGIWCRATAQAYELVISQNIIDNNNGVGIASCSSSSGLVIENNTIEGNRNFSSGVGCGVLLRETNMSRLKINGNWFESNGTDTTSAVDLFMLGPNDSTTTGALRTAIVAILPSAMQASFTTGGCGVGAVAIAENDFNSTKYSVVCAGDKAVITIGQNAFKGIKDRFNKHIFLGTPSGTYGLGGTRIDIIDNTYRNSDDPTIDPQVTTGIDNTIVYSDQAFNASATDQYFYNGVNLQISSGGKPQYIEVAGTTGAPNPGRFVGVTASVAPTSGTYNVGDFVITQAGGMYVCTVAGTPGTWVNVGSFGANVQAFTSTGAATWTKPTSAKSVHVVVISGGGGGGSGRKGAAGSVRCGGGGGGGGGVSSVIIPASALGTTVGLSVGAGGAGGAAVSASSTNGNNGGLGVASFFGPSQSTAYVFAGTGAVSYGAGGSNSSGTGGQGGYSNDGNGGAGGSASATGSTGNSATFAVTATGAGAGGAGGGITSGDSASNGGAGSPTGYVFAATGGSAGVVGGATPGAGLSQPANSGIPGCGGGGGAASISGNAQDGAAGGIYGGGGGGGGAGLDSVGNSGAGGNGANGIVVVTTYF